MWGNHLPPWHFPQKLIEILEKVPDYAEVFNDDPREGYLVLVFATLLSALGWYRLPRPSGLRLLISSYLATCMLVMLTRYKRLIHEPPEAIGSIVVILGLLNLLLLTKENDRATSALAAFSFIFSWSIDIAYPGIQQGFMHAFNLTPSSTLSRYVGGGADFSFVMAATLGSLIWINSGRSTANLQADTRRVAAVIVVATALLSLGEVGFLMLAEVSIASGTSNLAKE